MGVPEGKGTRRPNSNNSVDGSAASTLAPSAEPSMMEKSEVPAPQSYSTHPADLKRDAEDSVEEKSPESAEIAREEASEEDEDDDDEDYPKSWKLGLISAALCLSVFCMALVRGPVLESRKKYRGMSMNKLLDASNFFSGSVL
jgi:hypothetical protein